MIKITLQLEGMNCPMCELKVNESLRDAFSVKKVTSSHARGITELITEEEIPTQAVREVIEAKGFRVLDVRSEPYSKGFLFWKK